MIRFRLPLLALAVGLFAGCGEAPPDVDQTASSLIEHDEDWDAVVLHTYASDPAYNLFPANDVRNAIDAADAVALVGVASGRCTGFLVDEALVMTAHHCVYDDNGNLQTPNPMFTFLWDTAQPRQFGCFGPIHSDYRADVVTFRCSPDGLGNLPGDYGIAPVRLARTAPNNDDRLFQISVNCRCDEWSTGCSRWGGVGPYWDYNATGTCSGSATGGLYRLLSPGGFGQNVNRFDKCDVSNDDAEWDGRHGFNMNCDGMPGSSGAPVFHRLTGEVVGILSEQRHQGGSFNRGGEVWRFVRENDLDEDARLDSEEPALLSSWQIESGDQWFDVSRCHFLAANTTGGTRDDLVCVYDYGNASAQTFVRKRTWPTAFESFTTASPWQSQFNVNNCQTIEVADVNLDGWEDLVCPYDYSTSTRTFVQLGGPNGFTSWHLRGQTSFMTLTLDQCRSLDVADVDDNGYPDLVCVRDFGGANTQTYVQLSFSTGWSGWGVYGPYHAGTFNPSLCQAIEVADVNGDGRADLVCPYQYASFHRTFVQLGGTFGFGAWTLASGTTYDFSLADCRLLERLHYDADATPDLLCVLEDWLGYTRSYVQSGNSFAFGAWSYAGQTTQIDLDACIALGTTDLNGDGLDDLYCVREDVTIGRLNTGGALAPWDVLSAPQSAASYGPEQCVAVLEMQLDDDDSYELACPIDLGTTTTTLVLR
ncbi:MAG: VCBS repeat-containing protein [Deltaproteobacteria bacterium]|jgi:hypothetical protein